MKFQGTATAIVTPFTHDGSIDMPAFDILLEMQIQAGIEGIVPCGSTGEAATMTLEEKKMMIAHTVEKVDARTRVIAGTGSNDTQATIELTRFAKEAGADAVLLVGPYYNKPTQAGYIAHFSAIADKVDIPMIIYNVPGRTASNMTAQTQIAIAEYSTNFIATKEASGNLEQMQDIIASAPEHFSLLAGDDSLALPAIACGAKGVISVISNYLPKEFGTLVRKALENDFVAARHIQYTLLALMKANFIESNPISVKTALAIMGLISPKVRLPLTQALESTRQLFETELSNFQHKTTS